MKNILLAAALIWVMSSCNKSQGDWVHFSSYKEYVILNSGDTVTYSDNFVMSGMVTGATHKQLNSKEEQILLNYLDSTCRTDSKYMKFEDKADKWKRDYAGYNLSFMMKFMNHEISPAFSGLKVEDVKTIVWDFDSTYQRYVVDGERRLYYDIFEGE